MTRDAVVRRRCRERVERRGGKRGRRVRCVLGRMVEINQSSSGDGRAGSVANAIEQASHRCVEDDANGASEILISTQVLLRHCTTRALRHRVGRLAFTLLCRARLAILRLHGTRRARRVRKKAVFGGFSLPKFVLDLLLASLDASVDARAGLRPTQHLSPVKHAPHCEAPALFVRARRDPLIAQEHVESLAKKYKGPRTLALVEGSHSSPRDVDARRFVARFLARHLPLPPIAKRPPSATAERHLQCAPWSRVRTEFATPTPLQSRSRSMPPQSPMPALRIGNSADRRP